MHRSIISIDEHFIQLYLERIRQQIIELERSNLQNVEKNWLPICVWGIDKEKRKKVTSSLSSLASRGVTPSPRDLPINQSQGISKINSNNLGASIVSHSSSGFARIYIPCQSNLSAFEINAKTTHTLTKLHLQLYLP